VTVGTRPGAAGAGSAECAGGTKTATRILVATASDFSVFMPYPKKTAPSIMTDGAGFWLQRKDNA